MTDTATGPGTARAAESGRSVDGGLAGNVAVEVQDSLARAGTGASSSGDDEDGISDVLAADADEEDEASSVGGGDLAFLDSGAGGVSGNGTGELLPGGSGATGAIERTPGGSDPSGRVQTPGNDVAVAVAEKQQTLDGFLPLTLDMAEEGLFEFDRYELRPEVKKTLDVLADKLSRAPYHKLQIAGYADHIGDSAYNKRLSDKRAWAVAGYLMEKGVPPQKLAVEGKGETESAASGECLGLSRTEAIRCLGHHRRVEIAATVKQVDLEVR